MANAISVLIVDNHPEYLALVERAVTAGDIANVTTHSVQQISAVELELALTSGDHQLAFVDYETIAKTCSGHVARWIESIRLISSKTPIIIISATGDELLAVRMIQSGACDYIPKRLISARLIDQAANRALQNVLQRRRIDDHKRRLSDMHNSPTRITIDGYEMVRQLNKSNNATLYLANSIKLGQRVVLKLISLDADNRHQLPGFRREYEIVSRLKDKQVVDIIEFGEVESFAYIAMEYFPCGDLKNRLARPVSPKQALHYTRSIAKSLDLLHSEGIVHRDLKPANVMLREDDSVAIIDFGLAETSEDGAITQANEIRGTPYYISPEQVSGGLIDQRSDIYSLGVMFFEMLTGERPYTGSSALAIIDAHVNAPVPTLPNDLAKYQKLLSWMMAKSVEERYWSIEELLQDPLFDGPNLATQSRMGSTRH